MGCTGCGSSCWGWRVGVDEIEKKRVRKAARKLKIPNPFDGGWLRQKDDGSCLFLDANNRCRIYAARPDGCAQWPHLGTITERQNRSGMHGGCTNGFFRAWPVGPPARGVVQRRPVPEKMVQAEQQALASLHRVVPPRLLSTTHAWFRAQPEWVGGPPLMRASLEKLKEEPGEPTELSAARQEYVVRIASAHVSLRRWEPFTDPRVVALTVLVGSRLAMINDPSDVVWSLRLASWIRWMHTKEPAEGWARMVRTTS